MSTNPLVNTINELKSMPDVNQLINVHTPQSLINTLSREMSGRNYPDDSILKTITKEHHDNFVRILQDVHGFPEKLAQKHGNTYHTNAVFIAQRRADGK